MDMTEHVPPELGTFHSLVITPIIHLSLWKETQQDVCPVHIAAKAVLNTNEQTLGCLSE